LSFDGDQLKSGSIEPSEAEQERFAERFESFEAITKNVWERHRDFLLSLGDAFAVGLYWLSARERLRELGIQLPFLDKQLIQAMPSPETPSRAFRHIIERNEVQLPSEEELRRVISERLFRRFFSKVFHKEGGRG
jgi:hypothetical protein